MKTRLFFDSNTVCGPRPYAPQNLDISLAGLEKDMDHYGVSASLVRHQQAILHDPMSGNLRLIKELDGKRDRFYPCWHIVPNITGDMPGEKELAKLMNEHHVTAVELNPSQDNFPVAAEVLLPLSKMLNDHQALILVPWSGIRDPFRDLKLLSELCCHSNILITGIRWSNYRLIWAILEHFPNIHIEFSDFQAYRVIEDFSKHFGPNRLLFGSGAPDHSAGAARGLLDWSLTAPEVTDQIAAFNLCRLLKINKDDLPRPLPATEPIQNQGREGVPLTPLVLDAHCHVMDKGEASSGPIVMKQGDAAGQLEISSHCGVDVTAMMSWQGPFAGDVVAGNALMRDVVCDNPKTILGLSSIDPLQQSVQEMLDTIKHLHENFCFPGLKPYFPRNSIHYHEEVYDPIWQYANENQLYALLHTDESEKATTGVLELARRFPKANFIFAHSGGSWRYAELCANAASKVANIYCELTLTPVHNGIVEYLVEHAGQDKVLFGTDAPMRDPRPQLGWVVHSRLSTEAKKDVLGRNFLRILNKCKAKGMKAFAPRLEELNKFK